MCAKLQHKQHIFFPFVYTAFAYCQEFDCPESSPGVCPELEYPYAFDCTKFWLCTQACIAYLMDCPAGLHFSSTQSICLSPQDAMCQGE